MKNKLTEVRDRLGIVRRNDERIHDEAETDNVTAGMPLGRRKEQENRIIITSHTQSRVLP